MSAGSRIGPALYWAVAIVFIGFGILELIAIGAPFLLIGLAMAALWPVRRNPRVYWSMMVGVIGFIAGFILAAPLGCTSSAVPMAVGSAPVVGHTTCTNVLGLDYSGPSPYQPSLLPASIGGLIAALAGAGLVWLAGGRLRERAATG